jgi:subtilisin family serine protease
MHTVWNGLRAAKAWGLFLLLSVLLFPSIVPIVSRAQSPTSEAPNFNQKRTPVEFVPGEVLVRYRSETAAARSMAAGAATLMTGKGEIAMSVERFEGSDLVSGLRLVRVAAKDTLPAIAALNAHPDVLYAEPNYVRRKLTIPNDPRFKEMWGLRNTGQSWPGGNPGTVGHDIDAEAAWTLTTGSRSVVVGVIDEGIDVDHPDLAANIWRNPGEVANNGVDDDANGFVDDVNGWDFFHNDRTVFDGSGAYPADHTDAHGTHVAGTIGAVGNNGQGVTGVNWQVSLMSLKILGREGEGIAPSSVLVTVRAYNYARMMRDRWTSSGGARGANIRVLNNSYGGGGRSRAELDAIRALNDSGILFVVAAGNDARNNDVFPVFPASYVAPNLISVAATTNADLGAFFTNIGPATVSMAAPGLGILSTTPNGTYDYYSGTSMASPHVAGAAALLCAQTPTISVRRLRAALMYSGDILEQQDFYTLIASGRRLSAVKALRNVAENDTVAPAAVGNLQVTNSSGRRHYMTWTAPGDNGTAGQAALYEIRFSDTAMTTSAQFELGLPFKAPLPAAAGISQDAYVDVPFQHTTGYLAIRAIDNVGNTGPITSVPVSVLAEAADPYVKTESAAKPLSTGGTALGLNGDDLYRSSYTLPFNFPFFGVGRNFITISTNGAIYFGFPPEGPDGNSDDAWSTVERLNGYEMIAGLWDDLRTDRRPGDDVYVVRPDANRIIFRWQAVTFDTPLSPTTSRGENPVSFEIELRRDGTIETRYGSGNQKLFPVVGVSGGAPDAYVVASHTSDSALKSLTNAGAVNFTTRPPTPPTVSSLTLNPASLIGGKPSTGTVTLSRSAPSTGTVVTLSDDLAATTIPTSITFPAGAISKTFTINTTAVSAVQTGTVTAKIGSVSQTASLTVQPASLTSITLDLEVVVGGNSVKGIVTLDGPAPSTGAVVTLSDDINSTTVPASVTVPARATSKTFLVTTRTVSASEGGTITAHYGSVEKIDTLTVRPIGVQFVSINPSPVVGGETATGTVVLDRITPSALGVSLSDNIASTFMPALITVPAGQSSATFPITTQPVTTNQNGTLKATANGMSRSVAYTVKTVNGPLCSTMGFGPLKNYPVTEKPVHIVSEDFNKDGRPDLAIADNYFAKRVAVMYGDGSGGFGAASYYSTGPQGPVNIAVGDFNGDQWLDLAVSVYFSNDITIFLNDGAGRFRAATTFPVNGFYLRTVSVGDFNSDGRQDLAVTHRDNNTISILLGNGAGRFGAPTLVTVGSSPEDVAVGDFNSDGKQDLAVANGASPTLSILIGDGTGKFAPATNITIGYNLRRVQIRDFNKDGKQDLAVAGMSTNSMSVLLGKGTGGFNPATKYALGYTPLDMAVADMNGDGKDDLVFANSNSPSISIRSGDGTGRFGVAANYNLGVTSSTFVVKDFNGDSKLDLATTSYYTDYNVVTLLNTCR